MSKRRSTRRLFGLGCAGVLGCAAVGIGIPAWLSIRGPAPMSNVGTLDFTNPLAIPPILAPEIDVDGTKHFDLTLQTGSARIFGDSRTATWGANGPFLAPTLRATRGDHIAIAVHNELPEATSIHWHGMHLPAAMDGGPHQMIDIGQTWEPTWEIEQSAATVWYHPHPHGTTARHVYRGIAGLFLIDDGDEATWPVPCDWGVDDIPVIIQDKAVTDDDQFDEDPGNFLYELSGAKNFGIRGDRILINGTWNPFFTVTTRIVRLRLLNGSNTRFYNLGFDDDRRFRLLATDNGAVTGDLPELDRLLLGPGERAEVLVTFAPGEQTILRSFAQDLDIADITGRHIGADDTFDLLQFRAAASLGGVQEQPVSVMDPIAIVEPDGATVRTFELDGHNRINDREMDMQRIDEVIPAGALEIWEITSNGQPHTFHIHGSTFHVLSVNNGEVPLYLRGPKDTVKVTSGHPVRLAVQFLQHVDPTRPYMFHCHLLKHEDNGMMGQFVVVEPGMETVTSTRLDSVHMGH